MTLSGLHRPTHDRPTWIAFLQHATWAWYVYAFGVTQALLRDEQGTSRSMAALHGTALTLGGLVGALLATRMIRRWGRGRVLRASGLLGASSILLYTIPSGTLPVTLAGALLAAFFGSFLLVAVNGFLIDHQGRAAPTALTQGNALASLAGLLAPLAIGLGAASVLGWRSGMWAAVVALILVEIWRGPHVGLFGTRGVTPLAAETSRLPRRTFWSLGASMCFAATEFCLMFWGADLLRERCGFGPAAAAASVATITCGMLIGRLGGSFLTLRVPGERLLKASIGLSLVSFAVAWTATLWPLVLIGLLFTGIGISIQWPLGLSRSVRASGGLTDRATAATFIASSAAAATASFALGAMSERIGFHEAFLVVPVLLTTALFILAIRPVPINAQSSTPPSDATARLV